MTLTVTVAIPFVRVDASQNPNMRAGDEDGSTAYFRAMTVAFASVRRLHPDFHLELITDSEIPREFVPTFSALGVEQTIIAFRHRPPAGFSRTFEGSLFLLDALDHLTADVTILVDPDVILVRPLDSLLQKVGGRAGAVRIDYSSQQNINGLSREQAMELHALLGEPAISPQDHMGGEFYVIPKQLVEPLRLRVASAWALSLDRFERGESRFTTEEHVLTSALRGVPFVELNEYVRRIWTAHSFRNVTKADLALTAWHLPAEKNRGFATLYPHAVNADSWFWAAPEKEFIAKAATVMGMRARGPARLALGVAGRAARCLRELRVPVADRVAG